ncbi:MAG TPA: hypothetical protein VGC92_09840 [Phenylobacterium sp.]
MLSLILAAVAVAANPVTAAPPDAVVCHLEPIQGSRITHKVCLSAAQAAQLRAEARRLLDHAQAGYQPPNMANMVSMSPVR